MTENKPLAGRPGSQLGSAAAGRAVCLRAGSFPSMGLRGHICAMGMVAMMIFRRLTTHMFQKFPHESMILILKSLLNLPTREDLGHPSIHPTNIYEAPTVY